MCCCFCVSVWVHVGGCQHALVCVESIIIVMGMPGATSVLDFCMKRKRLAILLCTLFLFCNVSSVFSIFICFFYFLFHFHYFSFLVSRYARMGRVRPTGFVFFFFISVHQNYIFPFVHTFWMKEKVFKCRRRHNNKYIVA